MDSYGRIHEGTAPSQASTSLLKLSQCGISLEKLMPHFICALHRAPPPLSFLCSSLSVSSSHCLCLARKPLRSTASTAWRVPPLSPLPYSRPQSFYALHHHERYHHMNSAVVTSVGVQRSLLPLHLTLTPRVSGLTPHVSVPHKETCAPALGNMWGSCATAGYVELELSINGREYTLSPSSS